MADPLADALSKQGGRPATDTHGHDDWLAEHCPTIHALMSRASFQGTARSTSTVSVFFDENDCRLKAALHDRQARKSLYVTLDDARTCFESLEDLATSKSPKWRAWTKARSNGRA